jgi:hypothetical protein
MERLPSKLPSLINLICIFLHVTHLVDNENELSSTQLEILGEISKKVDNIVSQVAGEHKDLHGALSKIGKSIDRVS